jgi:hypothetical protein
MPLRRALTWQESSRPQQDYQRTLVILLEDFGDESLEQWIQVRPKAICPVGLTDFLKLITELEALLEASS